MLTASAAVVEYGTGEVVPCFFSSFTCFCIRYFS